MGRIGSSRTKQKNMPKGVKLPFTEKAKSIIESEYLNLPIKTLAKKVGVSQTRVRSYMKQKELVVPSHIAERRKQDSYFSQGHTPMNKGKKQSEYMSPESIEKTKSTRFQTGNVPHNTKFDGHERISKDGYIEIRIRQGKYRLKHLVEWENINGTLPDSHCLVCQDEDRTNTDPENWKLISRTENMLRNSSANLPEEIIPTLVLVNQIKHSIKTHENEQ